MLCHQVLKAKRRLLFKPKRLSQWLLVADGLLLGGIQCLLLGELSLIGRLQVWSPEDVQGQGQAREHGLRGGFYMFLQSDPSFFSSFFAIIHGSTSSSTFVSSREAQPEPHGIGHTRLSRGHIAKILPSQAVKATTGKRNRRTTQEVGANCGQLLAPHT